MSTFRDLFSGHAAEYGRYRPTYPDALFTWLADQAPSRRLAWDCGTGSGQAAVALGAVMDQVIATDASSAQLANAEAHPRVTYRVATAEAPGLAPASVDLATVAQAFHWFDAPRFFTAAAEVLVPGGVLALWTYRAARISPTIDPVELHFYRDVIGQDWPAERRLVEEGYASVVFPAPFVEMAAPPFVLTAQWSRDDFLGYVSTWSAVHQHRKRTGVDPLSPFAERLAAVWPDNDVQTVSWDLRMRVARRT
jgi:SAM-dependent methyltransferase